MYNPRLKRWTDPKATEGLLLFAQRAQECLFDYALDSYKAPALNTHSRCEELRAVVRDVADGRVAAGNIKPIVAELADSICADVATRTILGAQAASMGKVEWWHVESLPSLKTQAEMLRGYLWKGAYANELIRLLRISIADPQKKREILSLTTSLVVEWIKAGFSREYIYSSTKRFFFGVGGPKIDSLDSFSLFLELFDQKKKLRSFEILTRVSAPWLSLFDDSATPPSLKVLSIAPAPRRGQINERQFLDRPHDGAYLLLCDIETRDASSARNKALSLVSLIADLGTCHSHKRLLTWEGDALVWEGTLPTVLRESTRAIHKEDDCAEDLLSKKFATTLMNLGPGKVSGHSWSRLASSLALHSAAVRARDVSVQLSSLWAALEAMLPSQAEESKIVAIKNALVPVLSRHYVRKILADLLISLNRCCKAELDEAMNGLANKGGDEVENLGIILCINSNEPLRDKVYLGLERNPLLKNRVFTLKKSLESAKSVLSLFETHSLRVEWHLQRIYRTRNLLIHAGQKSNVIDSLVENLHSYFHSLFSSLEDEFARSPPAPDIDSALLRVRYEHLAHLALLKQEKDKEIPIKDARQFLFGL